MACSSDLMGLWQHASQGLFASSQQSVAARMVQAVRSLEGRVLCGWRGLHKSRDWPYATEGISLSCVRGWRGLYRSRGMHSAT